MFGIAVLTGDLIDSTRVEHPSDFAACLKHLLNALAERYQARVDTFRGDGFQVVLPRSADAPQAAIWLRAGLIAASPSRTERWDARVSVAIAASDDKADALLGPAYVASGRGLDAMENREHLRVQADSPLFSLAVAVATAFVDDTLNHWTPSEAAAYFEYLRTPGGHQAVAERLGKSRPTVTQALLRARYTLVDRYQQDVVKLLEMTHADQRR